MKQFTDENLALEDKFNNYHFKNIHLFHLDTLSIDILKHNKVPKHEVFRFQKDIKKYVKNVIVEKINYQLLK